MLSGGRSFWIVEDDTSALDLFSISFSFLQVEALPLRETVKELWRSEGLKAWKKGLSARLTQSCFFSFWLTLCYEPVKWFCLKEEYRDDITLF